MRLSQLGKTYHFTKKKIYEFVFAYHKVEMDNDSGEI